MGIWYNADGLKIDLGIDEATSQKPNYVQGGEYKTYGATRETELTIDLARLNAFGNVTILNDKAFFGAGWVPEQVEVETLVAVTGASATLSLGLVRNSDRTTAISATAFATGAALTQTAMAAVGTKIVLTAGSTGAGANIGVATTFDALTTATVNTANFTAGRIKVRIRWRPTVNI